MAELRNDGGALRFTLTLVAREGTPRAAEEGPAAGRLLATAGVEYLDERDGEWWPLLRLPPLHLPGGEVERLGEALAELLRGGSPGFAWRPGDDAAVALQAGAAEGGAVIEVGLDVGAFLADVAGAPYRPATELALVRFVAGQAELVRFADALTRDLEALAR